MTELIYRTILLVKNCVKNIENKQYVVWISNKTKNLL